MGLFDKVERGISSVVNGALSRAFVTDVDPREIAVALQKQLDQASKALDHDRRLAPNDFRVNLSRHDYDRLAPYSHKLNTECIPGLRQYAASRQYVFSGPITIAYLLDQSLPTGRFTVDSEVRAGVTSDEPVAQGTGGHELVLEVNGMRQPLEPPGFTIGRGTEADLRINDPNVSRLHAQITVEDIGDGQVRVSISDLGSTNGLVINGKRVRSGRLAEGSRIEIGSTRMLVHAPSGE